MRALCIIVERLQRLRRTCPSDTRKPHLSFAVCRGVTDAFLCLHYRDQRFA